MKRELKVLIVTQYFWPENFRINDLALGLQERGHMVEVITGLPNYPAGRLFDGYRFFNRRRDNFNGIPVYRTPLVPRGNGGSIRLALNFFSFAVLAGLSAPYRCRKKYDVIFVYEPSPITVLIPALIVKIAKFTPLMFWMQDLWPESLSATGAVRSTVILKLVELMVRLLYKGCDRILVQSRAFIAPIVRLGGEPNRIAYYPNSAEGIYRPIDVAKDAPERKLLPNGFRVIFAGNIGAAQDFETILLAAEQVKSQREIRFIILGDGRMLPWLRNQVKRRGLQKSVHLLGRYPVDAMPRFFALSDALLVTLKKEPIFALTIPSKIQSYLASAKPIVAALDGEGSRIIKEAQAGVTCPSQNPIELAKAVIKLYEMSEKERQEMGQRGRAYFERNFEREMLLDRLEVWMTEVAVQRRGKHANFDSRR